MKGFARYSTDSKWHVPHFEKMLYDQGQLAVSFSQAFQATKDPKFAKVVRDIVKYVNRDLRHPMGGYYRYDIIDLSVIGTVVKDSPSHFSAEDADSLPTADSQAKKEGAFCVWTKEELDRLLPANVVPAFCKFYNVEEGGNVDASGNPHGELLFVDRTLFISVLSLNSFLSIQKPERADRRWYRSRRRHQGIRSQRSRGSGCSPSEGPRRSARGQEDETEAAPR